HLPDPPGLHRPDRLTPQRAAPEMGGPGVCDGVAAGVSGALFRPLMLWRKAQHEAAAAPRILLVIHCRPMPFHGLLDDGQPQPGPAAASTLAMPEAVEDVRAVLGGDARSAITDADAAVVADPDLDGCCGVTMDHGVLHQVAQAVLDGMGVA